MRTRMQAEPASLIHFAMTEFERFATLGQRIPTTTLERFASYINPSIIEERKMNIATICTGMAASMGSVLLCAGTNGKRSILPHSRVMIHQPMGGARGQASDILIEAKEIEKLRKELYEIIASHTRQSFEKVFTDSDRDFWMTAEEAVKYGMVDKILNGNQ